LLRKYTARGVLRYGAAWYGVAGRENATPERRRDVRRPEMSMLREEKDFV